MSLITPLSGYTTTCGSEDRSELSAPLLQYFVKRFRIDGELNQGVVIHIYAALRTHCTKCIL